ncbi:hypothetical protein R1sor_014790 [Riccia sorocarpa]|uniref:Uncharacterized protein n=1 Tax=Riccia sorocarpa TaxID=122646 RepID=A0ABD3HEM2_9MARC
MRLMKLLLLGCVLVAFAAALPQCMSQQTGYGRRLTAKVKKDKTVDLRKGFHPRRSSMPRFQQESSEGEFYSNVHREIKDHAIVHGLRRLRSIPEEAGVVAKEWPIQFTISFTTKYGAATGFLAYDWVNERQAIYHGANSTFCQAFGSDDACIMLEIPSGTYVYLPSQKKCSLTAEGVGSVPPSWTTRSNYEGVELVPEIGLCRTFSFPPTAHIWAETVDGALPCLFIFPDPSKTYLFDPKTFKVGAPDEKLFDFPDFCFGPAGSKESAAPNSGRLCHSVNHVSDPHVRKSCNPANSRSDEIGHGLIEMTVFAEIV